MRLSRHLEPRVVLVDLAQQGLRAVGVVNAEALLAQLHFHNGRDRGVVPPIILNPLAAVILGRLRISPPGRT